MTLFPQISVTKNLQKQLRTKRAASNLRLPEGWLSLVRVRSSQRLSSEIPSRCQRLEVLRPLVEVLLNGGLLLLLEVRVNVKAALERGLLRDHSGATSAKRVRQLMAVAGRRRRRRQLSAPVGRVAASAAKGVARSATASAFHSLSDVGRRGVSGVRVSAAVGQTGPALGSGTNWPSSARSTA